MKLNKLSIALILISLSIIVVIAMMTVFTLSRMKSTQENANQTTAKSIEAAQKAEILGDTAAKEGNTNEAKQQYSTARSLYFDANDSSQVAEIDAKIYLLDHPVVTPEPVNAGSTTSGGSKSKN